MNYDDLDFNFGRQATRRKFLQASLAFGAGVTLFGAFPAAVRAIPGQESRIDGLNRLLNAAVLTDDQRLKTLLKLARAYHQVGQFQLEAATLQTVLNNYTLTDFAGRFARLNYGKALYANGDFEGAMLVLETLADDAFSMRAQVLLYAARAALAAGDLTRTDSFLQRLAANYPTSTEAALGLNLAGRMELKRGRLPQAIAAFQQCAQTPIHTRKRAASNLLSLMEAQLRAGDLPGAQTTQAQVQALAPQLVGAQATAPVAALHLRHRAAHTLARNSFAAEAIQTLATVAQDYAGSSATDQAQAVQFVPKSLVLAAQCARALQQRDQALGFFAAARQAGTINGQFQPVTAHALTGQALMALQENDRDLLTATLAFSSGFADADALRFYNGQMADLLQRYSEDALWHPLAQAVLNDPQTPAVARLQQTRNLSSSAHLAGNDSQGADYLLHGIGFNAFPGSDEAIETRLRLVLELSTAGRSAEADAQLAQADALIAALGPLEQPWFTYRAARTLLSVNRLGDAVTRLQGVRSTWPDSREARKALFLLAEASQRASDSAGAVAHYLDYINSYSANDPYAVQAAVLALQVIDNVPEAAPDDQTLNSLVALVTSNSATDWRSLAQTAQYFYRHGQHARAGRLVVPLLASFEAERTAAQLTPFSEDWLAQEERISDILFGLREYARLIGRVEGYGA